MSERARPVQSFAERLDLRIYIQYRTAPVRTPLSLYAIEGELVVPLTACNKSCLLRTLLVPSGRWVTWRIVNNFGRRDSNADEGSVSLADAVAADGSIIQNVAPVNRSGLGCHCQCTVESHT